ncbi:MAG: hypothetical protein AABY02_04140 [Nanoarchaeota archaeon]
MAENIVSHKSWYDQTYKYQLILSVIVLAFALGYLAFFYSANGDIIHKDISLTGGTTITVSGANSPEEIQNALRTRFPDVTARSISNIRTGEQIGFFVESTASTDELKSALEEILGFKLTQENSSIEFTGSALSSSFYQQLSLAVLIAFVGMGLVVFVIFKTPFRSLSIIAAGFADIVMTLALVDFIGMQISLAGIVALLMLIGYAVDTDMLLTTRVLRGEGPINTRIWGAFKTGITMTLTAIVAIGVSLFFVYGNSETLRQMFTILLIGLGFDIFNTWVTNATLLKWYAEARHLAQ